jgi:uncharacterized protein (DUF2384 family)
LWYIIIMEAIVEETILFVDAGEMLERLRHSRGRGQQVLDLAESVSWAHLSGHVHGRSLRGVAVLNLTAPEALTLHKAAQLSQRHPGLRALYVLDTQRLLPSGRALRGPGVDFISSRADASELVSRVQRLLEPLPAPRRIRSDPRTQSVPLMSGLMSEVHHPISGRLDAKCLADWLGISLKSLAHALGREYATVHKTPDAPALQGRLQVYLRVASALNHLVGSQAGARVWLNTPNADLEGVTPQSLLERTLPDAELVAGLLEDSLYGMPG